VGWKTAPEKIVEEVLRDKPFFEASGGGITLSGGEALAQPDFCREILRLSKAAGIHTAIETSGYAPLKVIESVEAYIDLWLYDIKLLDPEKCFKYTRRPLKPVLENLRHLNAAKRRIVMRCPMIPGINDSDAELRARGALADELDGVEAIDVMPYVPYGVDKAQKLGLKVYEAPIPPKTYGPEIVAKLSKLTRKSVRIP
jgi:pyruvate formate lyase activating enzyme